MGILSVEMGFRSSHSLATMPWKACISGWVLGWVFMLASLQAFAQSDQSQWPKTHYANDSIQAEAFEAMAWKYRESNQDSSAWYATQGLALAMKAKSLLTASLCLSDLAYTYKLRGSLDSAEFLLLQSIHFRDLAGSNKDKASGRNLMGWLLIAKGEANKALRCFDQGLQFLGTTPSKLGAGLMEGRAVALEKLGKKEDALHAFNLALEMNIANGDSLPAANTLLNLGNFFQESARPVLAMEHYARALPIYQQKGNLLGTAQIEMNIGALQCRTGQYAAALPHLQKAMEISSSNGFDVLLHDAYNNLALAYRGLGNPRQAEHFLQLDYHFCRSNALDAKATHSALNLAELALDQKHFEKALGFCDSATARSKPEQQIQLALFDVRKAAFAGLGNYQAAYQSAADKQKMLDSIGDQIQSVQELTDLYMLEKTKREQAQGKAKANEAELARERAEKKSTIFLLVTTVISILFISIYAWKSMQTQRLKIKNLTNDKESAARHALEQKRLEEIGRRLQDAEVNALRLSMETQERERNRIAENLHDHLGSKLSVVQMLLGAIGKQVEFRDNKALGKYTDGLKYLDEACVDVRQIARSMTLGDLSHFGLQIALERFCALVEQSGSLQVEFKATGIPRKLGSEIESEVYAMVRTALENILRHADAKQVKLFVEFEKDTLSLYLHDNGKGFDTMALDSVEGMGLKNMQKRASALHGTLEVESAIGSGTTILIKIPIQPLES